MFFVNQYKTCMDIMNVSKNIVSIAMSKLYYLIMNIIQENVKKTNLLIATDTRANEFRWG